jgi:hypothetical protein
MDLCQWCDAPLKRKHEAKAVKTSPPVFCRQCSAELPVGARLCPSCGLDHGAEPGLSDLEAEVARLCAVVAELQEVVDNNADVQDQIAEIIRGSNILSSSFWSRAWAI